MKTVSLYIPVKESFLTYEHINDARGLLALYACNLMQLHDYLSRREPSGLLRISSVNRLFKRLNRTFLRGTDDIRTLAGIMQQCPDTGDYGSVKLPRRFIKAGMIYRRVSQGTHPVVRLYRQYEYLFCAAEHSAGCTLYRARHLFDR